MKVAVFGAAGWVGRAVLENLASHHQIRACDYGPQAWEKAGPWSGGDIVHSDISDYDSVDRALSGMDALIHTAVYFGSHDKNDLGPFHAECQIDLITSLLVGVPGHGDERAETWSQRFGHLVNQDLTGRQKRGAGFFEPY